MFKKNCFSAPNLNMLLFQLFQNEAEKIYEDEKWACNVASVNSHLNSIRGATSLPFPTGTAQTLSGRPGAG